MLKKKLIALGLGTFIFNDAELQPCQFSYDSFDDNYLGERCSLLYIEITDICNFHCIHCYADIDKGNNKMMNMEVFENIISAVSNDGNCDIRLTGGKPFLNKNIREFINIIRDTIKPKTHHSIVTNGTFNINDALEALKNNFELQISIYGMTYETFYKFTDASKVLWNKVWNNLYLLSKSEYRENVLLCCE